MRPTGARSPGPGGLDSERTRPAGEIEHRRADQQEDEAPPEVHIDSQDARALDRARGDQDHAVKREQQSERQPKVSHFFHFVAGPHPRDLCLRGLRRSALLRRYRTFHQNRRFSATVSTETTRPSANVANSGALTKLNTSCSMSMMLLKRIATYAVATLIATPTTVVARPTHR